MHMADALLSPAVGGIMCAVSAGAVAYSAVKIKKDETDLLGERKIPVMGVMGAFVFAAQMINFTIPATGSSGHIGGGILLAAMLGQFPAFLTITAVLIIQSLFFADGGLLALGCNVFNMGLIPCLIAYPLIFKPIINNKMNAKRLTAASVVSAVIGLQAGAFCVVLETLASGITELPFSAFVLLMQPIHLAIGFVEGLVTAAVLVFVYKMRPEIIESSFKKTSLTGVSIKKVLVTLTVLTVLVGGGLSLFASSHPDGLEWAVGKVTGSTELEKGDSGIFDNAASAQEATAFMPDYDFKSDEAKGTNAGTAAAGLIGGALTFALAGAGGLLISLTKKRKKKTAL